MVADYENSRVEVSDGGARLMVDRREVLDALDVRTTEEIAAAAIALDAGCGGLSR